MTAADERHEGACASTTDRSALPDVAALAPLWTTDVDGRTTSVDPGWVAFTGVPADEGVGEVWIERVHPDDRDRVARRFRAAVADAAACEAEFRLLRHDGEGRWVLGRGVPRHAADGSLVGFGCTCVDVTGRRAAEDERRRALDEAYEARVRAEAERRRAVESRAHLDTIFDHAPVGVGFFDPGCRFVRLNEPLAEMIGLPQERTVGRTIAEVIPDIWPTIAPHVRRVLATGESVADLAITGQTPRAPGVDRHWIAGYYPVTGPGGVMLGFGVVAIEITQRWRAERAVRLLGEASRLLASDLPVGALADQVVRLPLPELADGCTLYLTGDDGRTERVADAHVDSAVEAALADPDVRRRLEPDADTPSARALRTGRAQLVGHVTPAMRSRVARTAAERALARSLDVCSALATPLRVGDRTLGVLTFLTSGSGRRYGHHDVPFAEQLASRLAQTIENARLREQAARIQERLDLLARVGELVAVDLDSRARVDAFLRSVLPGFGTDGAVYLRLDDGRIERTVRTASTLAAEPEREVVALDPTGPITATLRAVGAALRDVPHEEVPAAVRDDAPGFDAAAGGRGTVLSVPLPGPGGPFGVLVLGDARPGRRYSVDDLRVAEDVARRAAPALANAARFEHEHLNAEVLQRSLLPERLPSVDGVELAVRYLPGTAGLTVGGDWYDAVPLADGRLLLAIGDVAGHGVRAAATMGMLRHAVQLCAFEGLSPGETFDRLNAFLLSRGEAEMATACIVLVDAAHRRAAFASAGHPPPLLRDLAGAPRYPDGGRGTLLGATERGRFPEGDVALEPGAQLVLYTDGLVERRRECLDVGFGRLRRTVGAGPRTAAGLADLVVAEQLDGPPVDDVALLVLAVAGS